MRLFIGVLLVTMVAMALLIDDTEGWRRRRRRRALQADSNLEMREAVQEVRSFLDEVEELKDQLAAVDQGDMDLEGDDARK